jgi:filamentous hemagglutinin
MTLTWDALLSALGEEEPSARFRSLLSGIGEQPVIAEVPLEYNDPTGTTRFYKFPASGIEIGIRQGRLHNIHLFIQAGEGYRPYAGPLPQGIAAGEGESSVTRLLGPPARSGGPQANTLLGYMHRWIRYDTDATHFIRFEFARGGELRRLSVECR